LHRARQQVEACSKCTQEVGNERDARAVAATAWFASQRLEALQRKWQDLFKATARAAS
jgi:hypothetical protein